MPQKSEKTKRPPVIVVLGHVDHGKTTLLDHIRKSSVAAGEAGGITQSIGAYEISYRGEKMTFIDTPGHEAFSKMRGRGAKVADIAILVVSLDDGVQPQTKEAIQIVTDLKMPYVVALTKADKGTANVDRLKNELTGAGVLLEGYGGSVSYQAVSGKTGEGMPELLDLLLLATEVADLTSDASKPGSGVVLESKLDSKRGIIATVVVKDGALRVGDAVGAGTARGKVKGMESFLGERIKEAVPCMPVVVLGFESLPQIGEVFTSGAGISPAAPAAASKPRFSAPKMITPQSIKEGEPKVLNVILKANVSGSLEVLSQVVRAMQAPAGIKLTVFSESVGDITDGDVQDAISTGAVIVGFKVKPTKAAAILAEAHQVRTFASEIIYELVQALEQAFRVLDRTTIKTDFEILGVFGTKGGTQQVVGGKVVLGTLTLHAAVDIERRAAVIGTAKVLNLQQAKKDVRELAAGNEGGLLADATVQIKVGDHLIVR
jgi:translation initiation factor IF-2